MKWLGQHIWDFISRFRSDVYLENIDTGTIVSGGNLGLDSNNKIVKDDGDGVTDLHSAGVDGAVYQLLTDGGDGTITSELYGLFRNAGNVSTLSLLSNEDTGDVFTISTTTHGATTLTTVDDNATAAHMTLNPDGDVRFKPKTGAFRFMDSDNAADYFSLAIGAHGDVTLTTRDIAATAAHFEVAADGNITLDAAGDIALEADTTITGDLTVNGGNATINGGDVADSILKLATNTASASDDAIIEIVTDEDGTPRQARIGVDHSDNTLKLVHGSGFSDGTNGICIDSSGNVGIGTASPAASLHVVGDLTVTTEATIPSRKFTVTSATHFEYQGDVLYFGGGSTTQGDLCYLKEDGEWGQANATGAATGDDADRDAMGMLAIALGADPDVDGMFIRGTITMDYDLGDVGNPIYVKTTSGAMSSVAPATSGDFVRIVGYCLSDTDGQMYFNPDNTWVEIA